MNYIIDIFKILKKLKNRIIWLILIVIIKPADCFSGFGTDGPDNDEIRNLKAKAIMYDRKKETLNAIEFYRRYLSYETKDIKSEYRLATLYSVSRNYENAVQFYDSVIIKSRGKFPLAYYYKGIMCMNLQKYDNAIESFARFKKYYKARKDKNNFRKLALIYSASSEWAKNRTTDGKIVISHPGNGLNHSDIDFAPFPVNDSTLIYGAVYSDPARQICPIRQIYKSEKTDGKWKAGQLLEGDVNDPEFNTGNAVISEDGKRMYFTRTRKNWQNNDISEIFVSRFREGKWQTPEKLPYPINSENYTSTQPALGKNLRSGNDILYFVSDRPGGKGGLDIWYSEYDRKNRTFRKEANLSGKINTPGDECSPFYDIATQTLYFSSKGRKDGLGGFDIYKAKGSLGKWTDSEPLPKPLNSSYDDYFFSMMRNEKEGFFTSNRAGTSSLANGTCCDDIFTFRINDCTLIDSWGIIKNDVNYDFYKMLDEKYNLDLHYPENNSAVSDVPIELYINDSNQEILISKTSTDKNGRYSFDLEPDKQYSVLVKNYGYQEKKLSVSTLNKNCSDTISIGTTSLKYLPAITARINIYYDFDDARLNGEAKLTIDNMLMSLFDLFPTGIIEIGSHTDSVGTEEYNEKLSQKRSESIVNYLVSKGISPNRLVARGYGMSVPIASNKNGDGSDNPEGRKLNRRTEIRVVGQLATASDKE